MDERELENIFRYHPPQPDQVERYAKIRTAALAFARVLIDSTPVSADQSAAMRHLREAVMTANAAIALEKRG